MCAVDLFPFLSSLQLADAAFPNGRYALSHGLEAYASAGWLSESNLAPLLSDLLRFGAGPADGAALANAHRAVQAHELDRAAQADLRLTATKLTREARVASIRTGKQLLKLAESLFEHPLLAAYTDRVQARDLPGNHAVAVGVVQASLGIPREHALAGELYAFCAGCAGAAVRLAVIDHRAAQRLLHALKPAIAKTVDETIGKEVHEIASNLPLVDVMALRHERADARLFMT
ncbi:MAG TPA: urease accessory UreF family protein [Pirellulales bacterium]|nr:urease accessory UreF family protein [Pirellulales bacterium]